MKRNVEEDPNQKDHEAITYSRTVNGTNLKTTGVHPYSLLLELVYIREGVVADVYIAGQCEGKLSVREETRWCWLVVKPVENRLERVEPSVEVHHDLRCRWVIFNFHRHFENK